jgi:hypothetical protein
MMKTIKQTTDGGNSAGDISMENFNNGKFSEAATSVGRVIQLYTGLPSNACFIPVVDIHVSSIAFRIILRPIHPPIKMGTRYTSHWNKMWQISIS